MWTALFGMAVVAVDFGYLYTKKRSMQAVADAALKRRCRFQEPGRERAQTRASVALLSGYRTGRQSIDG